MLFPPPKASFDESYVIPRLDSDAGVDEHCSHLQLLSQSTTGGGDLLHVEHQRKKSATDVFSPTSTTDRDADCSIDRPAAASTPSPVASTQRMDATPCVLPLDGVEDEGSQSLGVEQSSAVVRSAATAKLSPAPTCSVGQQVNSALAPIKPPPVAPPPPPPAVLPPAAPVLGADSTQGCSKGGHQAVPPGDHAAKNGDSEDLSFTAASQAACKQGPRLVLPLGSKKTEVDVTPIWADDSTPRNSTPGGVGNTPREGASTSAVPQHDGAVENTNKQKHLKMMVDENYNAPQQSKQQQSDNCSVEQSNSRQQAVEHHHAAFDFLDHQAPGSAVADKHIDVAHVKEVLVVNNVGQEQQKQVVVSAEGREMNQQQNSNMLEPMKDRSVLTHTPSRATSTGTSILHLLQASEDEIEENLHITTGEVDHIKSSASSSSSCRSSGKRGRNKRKPNRNSDAKQRTTSRADGRKESEAKTFTSTDKHDKEGSSLKISHDQKTTSAREAGVATPARFSEMPEFVPGLGVVTPVSSTKQTATPQSGSGGQQSSSQLGSTIMQKTLSLSSALGSSTNSSGPSTHAHQPHSGPTMINKANKAKGGAAGTTCSVNEPRKLSLVQSLDMSGLDTGADRKASLSLRKRTAGQFSSTSGPLSGLAEELPLDSQTYPSGLAALQSSLSSSGHQGMAAVHRGGGSGSRGGNQRLLSLDKMIQLPPGSSSSSLQQPSGGAGATQGRKTAVVPQQQYQPGSSIKVSTTRGGQAQVSSKVQASSGSRTIAKPVVEVEKKCNQEEYKMSVSDYLNGGSDVLPILRSVSSKTNYGAFAENAGAAGAPGLASTQENKVATSAASGQKREILEQPTTGQQQQQQQQQQSNIKTAASCAGTAAGKKKATRKQSPKGSPALRPTTKGSKRKGPAVQDVLPQLQQQDHSTSRAAMSRAEQEHQYYLRQLMQHEATKQEIARAASAHGGSASSVRGMSNAGSSGRSGTGSQHTRGSGGHLVASPQSHVLREYMSQTGKGASSASANTKTASTTSNNRMNIKGSAIEFDEIKMAYEQENGSYVGGTRSSKTGRGSSTALAGPPAAAASFLHYKDSFEYPEAAISTGGRRKEGYNYSSAINNGSSATSDVYHGTATAAGPSASADEQLHPSRGNVAQAAARTTAHNAHKSHPTEESIRDELTRALYGDQGGRCFGRPLSSTSEEPRGSHCSSGLSSLHELAAARAPNGWHDLDEEVAADSSLMPAVPQQQQRKTAKASAVSRTNMQHPPRASPQRRPVGAVEGGQAQGQQQLQQQHNYRGNHHTGAAPAGAGTRQHVSMPYDKRMGGASWGHYVGNERGGHEYDHDDEDRDFYDENFSNTSITDPRADHGRQTYRHNYPDHLQFYGQQRTGQQYNAGQQHQYQAVEAQQRGAVGNQHGNRAPAVARGAVGAVAQQRGAALPGGARSGQQPRASYNSSKAPVNNASVTSAAAESGAGGSGDARGGANGRAPPRPSPTNIYQCFSPRGEDSAATTGFFTHYRPPVTSTQAKSSRGMNYVDPAPSRQGNTSKQFPVPSPNQRPKGSPPTAAHQGGRNGLHGSAAGGAFGKQIQSKQMSSVVSRQEQHQPVKLAQGGPGRGVNVPEQFATSQQHQQYNDLASLGRKPYEDPENVSYSLSQLRQQVDDLLQDYSQLENKSSGKNNRSTTAAISVEQRPMQQHQQQAVPSGRLSSQGADKKVNVLLSPGEDHSATKIEENESCLATPSAAALRQLMTKLNLARGGSSHGSPPLRPDGSGSCEEFATTNKTFSKNTVEQRGPPTTSQQKFESPPHLPATSEQLEAFKIMSTGARSSSPVDHDTDTRNRGHSYSSTGVGTGVSATDSTTGRTPSTVAAHQPSSSSGALMCTTNSSVTNYPAGVVGPTTTREPSSLRSWIDRDWSRKSFDNNTNWRGSGTTSQAVPRTSSGSSSHGGPPGGAVSSSLSAGEIKPGTMAAGFMAALQEQQQAKALVAENNAALHKSAAAVVRTSPSATVAESVGVQLPASGSSSSGAKFCKLQAQQPVSSIKPPPTAEAYGAVVASGLQLAFTKAAPLSIGDELRQSSVDTSHAGLARQSDSTETSGGYFDQLQSELDSAMA
ncbi:unnamed protein product [Amoebophrya sp. A120]|nr:unnamed protein product [Amoebophrya sp. A120]|eukprot:GSA120T00003612001.1